MSVCFSETRSGIGFKKAPYFIYLHKKEWSMARRTKTSGNPNNPFRFKAGSNGKPSGKRVGKSKPGKADNQLNRRVK